MFRQNKCYLQDWTLIVLEVLPKNKLRPLAAISLNVRCFVTDQPNTRMEAKFNLRPLRAQVEYCTLQLDISSRLLKECDVAASAAAAATTYIRFLFTKSTIDNF